MLRSMTARAATSPDSTRSTGVLRALADDAVVGLFRRGYLHLIYLMIASLKRCRACAKKNRLL